MHSLIFAICLFVTLMIIMLLSFLYIKTNMNKQGLSTLWMILIIIFYFVSNAIAHQIHAFDANRFMIIMMFVVVMSTIKGFLTKDDE